MIEINFTIKPLVESISLSVLQNHLYLCNITIVTLFLSHDNNPIPLFDDMIRFHGLFFYSSGPSFELFGILEDELEVSHCLRQSFKIDRILAIMPT